jgi:hypothetical protein
MMFDVKVGDKLRCLVDRPDGANVNAGEYVTVTKVRANMWISFVNFPTHRAVLDWMGSLTEGEWEPVIVDLENK